MYFIKYFLTGTVVLDLGFEDSAGETNPCVLTRRLVMEVGPDCIG